METNVMPKLPYEMWYYICSFLSNESLSRVAQIDHANRALVQLVWRQRHGETLETQLATYIALEHSRTQQVGI